MIRRRADTGGAAVRDRGARCRSALRAAAALALLVAGLVILGACAYVGADDSADTGLRVEVARPIPIPRARAHAAFQQGRVVRVTNKQQPYCELETRTVAETVRLVEAGRFRVSRVSHQLLIDPTTRIPALIAGFGCSDDLFQESVWRLRAEEPTDVLWLRCLAPYFNCRIGPPLSPDQVQQVVGPYLSIRVLR